MKQNETVVTLKTQFTLTLHTTKITRLDYCSQQITEFIYKLVRRKLLITDVVKGTTAN